MEPQTDDTASTGQVPLRLYCCRDLWGTIHTEGWGCHHPINVWSSGVELISPVRVLSTSPWSEYDLNFP